jgi:filamentous hemagglutinin family protein
MSRHASINRIYRLVWIEVRSAWVPVAETARGRGKSGRAKSVFTYGVVAGVSLALASLTHASGAPPPCAAPACGIGAVSASSHPTGDQVVSGRGRISQAGDTTTIQQSSQNLFLDWLSFNIGSEVSVNFVQHSANAIAVNEISSINGSQILGHLNANGELWPINPNAIVFGQGAGIPARSTKKPRVFS